MMLELFGSMLNFKFSYENKKDIILSIMLSYIQTAFPECREKKEGKPAGCLRIANANSKKPTDRFASQLSDFNQSAKTEPRSSVVKSRPV